MGVDHLGEVGLKQEIMRLWSAVRKVSKATLQNGSIGRAGLRIYEGGRLRIEGGGGIDIVGTGYINIDGDITGAGDFEWTGPWKFTGAGTITGTVGWSGGLNLTGNIMVKSGGRIVIEGSDQIVLEQSGGVARLKMGASEIRGGDGIGIYPNSGPSIISTSAGLRIANLPTISGASVGLPAGTLYINATGFVYRTV